MHRNNPESRQAAAGEHLQVLPLQFPRGTKKTESRQAWTCLVKALEFGVCGSLGFLGRASGKGLCLNALVLASVQHFTTAPAFTAVHGFKDYQIVFGELAFQENSGKPAQHVFEWLVGCTAGYSPPGHPATFSSSCPRMEL